MQIDTEAAMQRLYEDPSLTEELTDDDAKMVLEWAQEQVKQLAAKFTDEAAFDDAVKSLLRVVKNANRVVGQRDFADPTEQEERIDKMTEAAMGMGVVTATAQAAEVRDQLNALSSTDALKRLLTMFTPGDVATSAQAAPQSTSPSAPQSAPASTATPAEDAKSVFSSLFDRLTGRGGEDDADS